MSENQFGPFAHRADQEELKPVEQTVEAGSEDVAYFGPFKAGDTVSINGSVPLHVIEVTSAGVRAVSVTEQPFWFPREAVKVVSGSMGAVARPSSVDNRVVEDSTMGDPSLPMKPPPQPPGGESTFR